MFSRLTPLEEENEGVDLTGVNGAPSAMDEDGELEEDSTPLIQSLAVKTSHPKGAAKPMTDIIATIHTAQGISSKRLVLPGEVTAQQLANVLLGVASW